MAHYLSVLLVVKDQEALAEYFKVGAAAVAKHEGRAFAGGPETKVLQESSAPSKGVQVSPMGTISLRPDTKAMARADLPSWSTA